MKRVRMVGAMLVAGSLLSCSDGPTAGELDIVLETSRTDLGAIQFTVRSAEPATIESLTAGCSGCAVFQGRVAAAEVRGIVTGDLSAGTVLRMMVPDVALAAAYAITIQEAATRTFDALPSTGITLRISPAQ